MSLLPSVCNTDHPLNTWMKRLAPVGVLLLVGLLIFAQQFLMSHLSLTVSKAPPDRVASEATPDPGVGGFVVNAKMLVKSLAASELIHPAAEDKDLTPQGKEEIDESMKFLEELAISRTDRVRYAMVVGEVYGPRAALQRIGPLKREVSPDGELAQDVESLRRLYASKVGTETPPDQTARDALVRRHAWFGRLALACGEAQGATMRRYVTGGFGPIAVILAIRGLVMFLAFIGGLVLFFMIMKRARDGEFDVEIEETGVPSFIYIETFGVALLVFLVSTLFGVLLAGQTGAWAAVLHEALTWCIAAAVFYPLLRGVTLSEMRIDLGWHSGRGIGSELAAGLAGWMISMPLTAVVAIVVAIMLPGDEAGGGTGVPMFEQPLSSSWAAVIMSAIGSVVWAPFVEESLFRGCLHRWMPAAWRVAGRVAVSAIIFGFIHPYSAQGLLQVAAGGVVFGLLREWRGSLLAPMIAHFLHNLSIEIVTLVILAGLE